MTDIGELLLLAESHSWQDRSRAGQRLVAWAGEPVVDAVLLRLLLDVKDTAVTAATADALLARADLASWRIFARAWALATITPGVTNHIDHLYSRLNGAMYIASMDPEKAATIRGIVQQLLSGDEDENVKLSAREICDLVFEGL